MPQWKTTIDISDLHRAYRAGNLLPSDLGKAVAERVRKSRYAVDLEGVSESFDCVEDIDDYDEALRQLYDFGDDGHRIWIDTIGRRAG